MAVIRWEPVRELHSLQQEMNRLFGSFLETPGTPAAPAGRQWVPAMDLVERDDRFVLRADLPGVREQDVAIEVEDTLLTISGERHSDRHETREGYHRIERATGTFRRSLTLPEGIDAKSISAHFEGGVLDVTIPKPAQRAPERVQISLGGDASTAGDVGEQIAGEAKPVASAA
jgi:HSP20 family protein